MKLNKRIEKYFESGNGVDTYLEALDLSSIVSVTDRSGNILFVNRKFEIELGYKEDEIIGKNYSFLSSGKHSKSFFKEMWEKLTINKEWIGEVCNKKKNGSIIWLHTIILPINDENDEVKYYLAIRRNITELKFQEEENWKQLQLQSYINNHSSNIIIRTDLNGEINYVNNAFIQTLGYSSYEVLFVKSPDSFITPDCLSLKSEEFKNHFKFESKSNFETLVKKTTMLMRNEQEWDLVTKDQKVKCFKLNINFFYSQDQKASGYIIIGVDVSEKKELEKNILQSQLAYEKVLKLKSEFLSKLSHEIKTPLNGVLGMVNILENTELNTEQREYLDIIQTSSNRLLSLINKTIEFNKIEDAKFELNEKRFSITQLIFDINQNYRIIAKQSNNNFEIINKLENDFYLGDEKRISQVINYYLENAFKYTVSGSITLTIYNENDEVVFEVRDTGEGIPAEDQKRLFEPHFTSKNHFQGLGLSLAIIDRIARGMKAKVGFKSSLNHGSMFYFRLSLVPLNVLHLPEQNEDKYREFKDISILIVEDETINQRLLKKIMNKFNIYPEVVSNGLEAIEIQKISKFDLIFMDINMPIMDGIEATKIIRSNPIEYGTPIIVAVTANSITGDEDICLKSGMNDYIPKPINRERLETLLYKLVGDDIKNLLTSKKIAKSYYIQKIVEDFYGDEDILLNFICDIVTQMPKKFELLKEHVKNNNFEEIRRISKIFAEQMKTIHQDELYDMFFNLKMYGKNKKAKNIMPMLNDIEKKTLQVFDELRNEFFKEAA